MTFNIYVYFSMNSRNYSIDVLKFICAGFIVFIHTDWQFHQEFLPLTRFAVPCFFMISGYLLFDKEQKTIFPERIKRNIIHIGKILLWATLFYMIWDEVLYITSHDGHFWVPPAIRWIKMLVLNVPLFGHHLWYLFAYVYVLFIIIIVARNDKWKFLYYMIPLLLIPHIILLLSGRYLSIFLVRNFLFLGLPFFAIGTFIKAKSSSICKIKPYSVFLFFGIVVFSVSSLLERQILLSLGKFAVRELYISSFFLAICLFLLTLTFESKNKSWLSEMGEKNSLYIYIFHPVFVYCCRYIFNHANLSEVYMYIAPVVVLASTLVFVKCLRLLKIIK